MSKLVENVTQAILSPSSKPRWRCPADCPLKTCGCELYGNGSGRMSLACFNKWNRHDGLED